MWKRLSSLALLAAVVSAAADSWDAPERNALESQKSIRLCKRLAWGWLEEADPRSGLIPRNLRGDWFWNAKDAAADNFPFLLLTAFITGDRHLQSATLEILEQEQRLTNRFDRLPDDFLFDRQGFRQGPYRMDAIVFGASEYAKDGLTPITEWLGPGPWLQRMQGLVEDIWKHAPEDSTFGKLPSLNGEVNGNLLQVCSRLFWLTREQKFRRWVFRLADYYLLEHNILESPRLQLDDHSCEIIGGLSEAYLVASKTDPDRWTRYRPRMHAILDRVLDVGRNDDGLLYHTVNPVSGEVLNHDLTDNWGYNYNAFLTVADIDQVERYRQAVGHVLRGLHKYQDYPWENAGADGYADSIEGAINLLNRVPVDSAFQWVEQSMQILMAKQGEDGIVEGWHGDGNSARTALLYALWKTQGITASPWRRDLQLGAARAEGGGVRLFLRSARPWRGTLRFDRQRHRDWLHLPSDYARINQFPEWTSVEPRSTYRIEGLPSGTKTVTGEELWDLRLALEPDEPLRIAVFPEP